MCSLPGHSTARAAAGGDLLRAYATALREQGCRQPAHYLWWARALVRACPGVLTPATPEAEVSRWLEGFPRADTRRAARKGLRRFARWLAAAGHGHALGGWLDLPTAQELRVTSPDQRSRPGWVERLRANLERAHQGTLGQRQRALLVTLYLQTDLAAARLGRLRGDELQIGPAAGGTETGGLLQPENLPLDQVLVGRLDLWLALRERLRVLPAERRRLRRNLGWAESGFLFPAPGGGPSAPGTVGKALRRWLGGAAGQGRGELLPATPSQVRALWRRTLSPYSGPWP